MYYHVGIRRHKFFVQFCVFDISAILVFNVMEFTVIDANVVRSNCSAAEFSETDDLNDAIAKFKDIQCLDLCCLSKYPLIFLQMQWALKQLMRLRDYIRNVFMVITFFTWQLNIVVLNSMTYKLYLFYVVLTKHPKHTMNSCIIFGPINLNS